MNRNDRTRVIRVENDRQGIIVQPQVSRRYTRPSELKYYRTSDRANLNYNVAEQKRRSQERLVRRNNIPYNANEMYRHNRSRKYESYTEDSDSETDYSSEYSSGESDSEIYVYPRETRLVKVNPTTRGSSSYSDRRITNTNRPSAVHNNNRNVANGQSVVLEQKQPEINRVEYIKPKYNSRLYSDAESETDSSSETDSIYYRDNARLARAAPTLTGNNRRVIPYNENEDQKREIRPVVVRKVNNDETVAPRRVLRYENSVHRREMEYDNNVGRNREVRPVVVRKVKNDETVAPRRVLRYENSVHRREMEYDNNVGRNREVRPVVVRKVNNDEHVVPRRVMRYENSVHRREMEYDNNVGRNREVRPVVVRKVNNNENVSPRRIIRYDNTVPRRETGYDNDVSRRKLHYNGEAPSIRKNEIRNVVRPEVNEHNTVPLRNVKYTERPMHVISSTIPRVADDIIPVQDRAVLVRNNPSGGNSSPTKTTRTAHAVRQETLPPIGYVRRHNSNVVDRMMHSRDRNSITSSSLSSDSYDTDDSSSDSTSSDMTGSHKNKSIESNQTGLYLLDYTKMLQSREERKKYEKERKNHEHETHVVTLVQKEINKPRHNVSKCDKKNDNSGSVHKQPKCQTTEKAPKPLPKNEKVKRCLEETEEIKRNIRIEEQRRRKREERGRLEAWIEGDNTMDDDDFLAKDDIKQPTVYDFDKCTKFTPEMDNRSEEEDKVEVHVKYDEKFEDMYPEPRQKGCQLVYYIDLTKPPEILEPKPFDVETRRIVPQPKVNTIYSFVY